MWGKGAHVVESIGEFHQKHADVGTHRTHHLPHVLGLLLDPSSTVHAGDLGDAIDQCGHVFPEDLAEFLEGRQRVLDGVVQ